MGVPGLYSFLIEKNKNLSKYSKLDHSKIIIDGTSISYHLLHHSIKDARIDPENQYQIYFDYVMNFFQKFIDHKVDIFVFVNGAWKEQNLDSQIKVITETIKNSPIDVRPIDYLYYKTFKHDIFVEVLKGLNIKFTVCPFHAADVIATTAKILNYPVLTANADLFLFGTDCIFFRNLLFKNNGQPNMSFLCKISRPHEFIKMYSGLDIFCLPLLSVLLNDDYFPDDNLHEIFLPYSLPNFDKFNSLPHYKIEEAFKWLSNHTLDSAVEIILDKIKTKSLTHIESIINSYTGMSTYMFNYCTNLQSFTINQIGLFMRL
ncbi:protein asteroid homolog 1-like isoform X2 [Chelonus insularis]|uniref:protein asteroid homolog 1-like isoform X2 n=1 Tax=Chelonus insularis TaxID=460826 RepID=UPI00158EDDDD|nr:protein asteroid homolog 1-like isoform X2 [Chelonus insularis]